jgi:hypothetical protein
MKRRTRTVKADYDIWAEPNNKLKKKKIAIRPAWKQRIYTQNAFEVYAGIRNNIPRIFISGPILCFSLAESLCLNAFSVPNCQLPNHQSSQRCSYALMLDCWSPFLVGFRFYILSLFLLHFLLIPNSDMLLHRASIGIFFLFVCWFNDGINMVLGFSFVFSVKPFSPFFPEVRKLE